MDYAFYNGNYYGFLANHYPGGLLRLDFGSSLLNTPTVVSLGNFGGIIPSGYGAEGIQIIYNEGKWYAIMVGGYPPTGSTPRILKIEFGANLANPTPVAINWGNIGNMLQPIDLDVFKEGNNWYGFTINAENNTITKFSFTNSFSNTPTAVNLGNIGNLSYPTGIYTINDNGFWRVFIVNAGTNDRVTGPFSLTRLDFGSSLLNTPSGVNLGNPGNLLKHPRDLTIMKSCGQIIGFAVNGSLSNSDVVKMNFNNNLSSIPTFSSLGNVGNSNFPHSISKLFRVKDQLYAFTSNVGNNTVTRLMFNGCNNSSISSSQLQTPPGVSYNTTGTYNINLTIDDGLPTQNAICKQIVVIPALNHTALKSISFCAGETVRLGAKERGKYKWNTGSNTDSITVSSSGIYWVETSRGSCYNRDSFNVTVNSVPVLKLPGDTTVCKGSSLSLNPLANNNFSYSWSPATGLSSSTVGNPIAIVNNAITYIVTASNLSCVQKDTISISAIETPVVSLGNDTTLCKGQTLVLDAKNIGGSYKWNNGSTSRFNTVSAGGIYSVTVANSSCSTSDSIMINMRDPKNFNISPSVSSVCKNDTIRIKASGGDTYQWLNIPSPANIDSSICVIPTTTTTYSVKIVDNFCNYADTLFSTISIKASPSISVTKSNDISCTLATAHLNATGGND